MEEQVEVMETLGRGNITINFTETDQPVEWYETQFSGIWLVHFAMLVMKPIVYTLEVGRYPSLCGAFDEDIEAAEEELQTWIDAADM